MIACPCQNGHAPVAFPRLRVVLPSQPVRALARVCEKQGSRVVHGARYHAELVLYDRARWDARPLELDTSLRGQRQGRCAQGALRREAQDAMESLGVNAARGLVRRSGEDDASMTKEGAAQGHEEMVDEHCLAAATAAVDDNVEKPLVQGQERLLWVGAARECLLHGVHPERVERHLLVVQNVGRVVARLLPHDALRHVLRASH